MYKSLIYQTLMYKTIRIISLLGLLGLAGIAQANPTYYTIQPTHHDNFCVGVRDRGTHNTAAVDQYKCHGGDNRLWVFESSNDNGSTWEPVSDGVLATDRAYRIKNVNSGKFLSIQNRRTDNSAPVWQWAFNGYGNQLFELTEKSLSNGRKVYRVKAKHSGKCLTVPDLSTKNTEQLVQDNCNTSTPDYTSNQIFDIKIASFGVYSIKNIHANVCLDLPDSDHSNGSALGGLACTNDSSAHPWKLVVLDDTENPKYYRIINRNNHKCMGVDHSRQENGAQLTQWDCHGGDNQMFELGSKLDWTGFRLVDNYQLIAKHSNKCVVFDNQSDGYTVFQHDCNDSAQRENSLFSVEGSELVLPETEEPNLFAGFNIVYRPIGVGSNTPQTKCLMGPSLGEIETKLPVGNLFGLRIYWEIELVDDCHIPNPNYGKWVLAAPYSNSANLPSSQNKITYVIGNQTSCLQAVDFDESFSDSTFDLVLTTCIDDVGDKGQDIDGGHHLGKGQNFTTRGIQWEKYKHQIKIFSTTGQTNSYFLGVNSSEVRMISSADLRSYTDYKRTFYFTPYTE